MDDTRDLPPAPPDPAAPDDGDRFEPRRFQTLADMRRTRDDRLVAGVCTGVGRHLGVDPVLVRVVVVVLSFVGLAGVILYVAAWLLVPQDGEARSIVGRWFNLDQNEDRVRSTGLVVAAVLAALAVVGDGGWGWGDDGAFWGVLWLAVPVAFLYWLFAVLPRRRRREREAVATSMPSTAATPPVVPPQTAPATVADGPGAPRSRYPWTLTVLGLSALAISQAVTYLVADPGRPVYVAVAVAVVGAILLLGALTGGGGPMILLGLVLCIVLAGLSVVPNGRTGDQYVDVANASQLEDRYEHGAGRLTLDLRSVDPATLTGREVELDAGFGETRVLLPDGLEIDAEIHVRAGDLLLLDERRDGLGQTLTRRSSGPALTLRIDQTAGLVEVTR